MAGMMKLACVMVLCVAVASGPMAEAAVTCGAVASKVTPCIPYLTNKGGPSPGCCAGVKGLVAMAPMPADKKTVCNCLKSAAGSIPGLDYGKAAALPSQCRVSIPYKISPSTNCATIKF